MWVLSLLLSGIRCHRPRSCAGMPAPRKPAPASLLAPPVKAVRYNLRQRTKIKVPPRFATALKQNAVHAPEGVPQPSPDALNDGPDSKHTSENLGPEVPESSHVLDLCHYVSPKAIMKQPHGDVHVDIFNNAFQENAIFSHAWSPDGCSLFSCGGPLAMGVRGCYMALWC